MMRSLAALLLATIVAFAPALAVEQVPVSGFRQVELRGGGEVILRRGPVQQVTILDGSSRFSRVFVDGRDKLRIDACSNRCPDRYRLRIEIQSPDAPDVAISGGGSIRALPGFPAQTRVGAAVHGGGTIDVRAIDAGSVKAAINGGGQILVRPRHDLLAAVNGGGRVAYGGQPAVRMIVNGGGVVQPLN